MADVFFTKFELWALVHAFLSILVLIRRIRSNLNECGTAGATRQTAENGVNASKGRPLLPLPGYLCMALHFEAATTFGETSSHYRSVSGLSDRAEMLFEVSRLHENRKTIVCLVEGSSQNHSR